MLKLFGQARSRASRSLWMLEEIGIPYEHIPVRPYTERPPGLRIDHALVYQWSLWAANEIEPRIVSIAKGLSKWSPDPSAAVVGFEQLYATKKASRGRRERRLLWVISAVFAMSAMNPVYSRLRKYCGSETTLEP
jgi:glutathione S-transferase